MPIAGFHGGADASALVPHVGPAYHYTSSEGLLGIVTSGLLRASETRSLNDPSEVELGGEAVEKWLSKRSKSRGAEFAKDFLEDYRRDSKHLAFVLSGTTAGEDANQ